MKRFLALTLCLLAGCASMHTDQGDARTAILAANSELMANAKAGNADKLVTSFYADDAIVMPPNEEPFRGRDSIKQLFTIVVGKGVDVTLTTDNVIQSCDMATEIGHYEIGPNHDPQGTAITCTVPRASLD